jgi:elongation factor G
VDFSAEVERSLRVCDGAVAVFDGMMGVETQSETVWQQANKFGIPRIGFINKMDRVGAVMDTTTSSIKRRLKVEPIMLNIPSSDEQMLGLIDLTQNMFIDYSADDMGKIVTIEEIDSQHALFDKLVHHKELMVSQLANYCDDLADLYLENEIIDIQSADIDIAVRKALQSLKAVPMLCGSALKNKGVQPLLDSVIKYLPSPENQTFMVKDVNQDKMIEKTPSHKDKLCALAFKVVNDKEKGLVTFFRVYSGVLKNRAKLRNVTLGND